MFLNNIFLSLHIFELYINGIKLCIFFCYCNIMFLTVIRVKVCGLSFIHFHRRIAFHCVTLLFPLLCGKTFWLLSVSSPQLLAVWLWMFLDISLGHTCKSFSRANARFSGFSRLWVMQIDHLCIMFWGRQETQLLEGWYSELACAMRCCNLVFSWWKTQHWASVDKGGWHGFQFGCSLFRRRRYGHSKSPHFREKSPVRWVTMSTLLGIVSYE